MNFSRKLRAAALATALLCPAGAAAQIDEEDLPAPVAPGSAESTSEAAPDPADAVPAEAEPAPLTPAEMVSEAERLYSEGDLEGATQLYRQAVAEDRRAQLGIFGGQATLFGSVGLFIYDLRDDRVPTTIPYPGPPDPPGIVFATIVF